MLNLKDIFKTEEFSDDCFSNKYAAAVDNILSKSLPYDGHGSNRDVICEATLNETKTKRIKEDLVRCVWHGQHYAKDRIFTEDGSRLEVVSPGWWNVEDGPDFHHAEILFEKGGLKKGDVEIHVFASDWNKHGHNAQKSYNNVCLHVAMWNDRKDDYVYNEKGEPIPQLALNKYLDRDLDELFSDINIEDYPASIKTNAGLCQKSFRINEQNIEKIGRFLDCAGDERIISKGKRFSRLLNNGTFEQTLYEAIMEALGYKNNKGQFRDLAGLLKFTDFQEIVPIDLEKNEKALFIQAAFFGMAGLLPGQNGRQYKSCFDNETDSYIKSVEKIWESEISPRISVEPMNGASWQFGKSRPANFPTRRIAAMSHIIVKSVTAGLLSLFIEIFEEFESGLSEKKQFNIVRKGIDRVFQGIFDDYWSHYYTFGGKRAATAERLLGKERTFDILINVIIPLLLINSRKSGNFDLEKRLHLVFRMFPKLTPNQVTSFMANRIFSGRDDAANIVNNARRQQGLHQIFNDFCDSDNFLCEKCPLFLIMKN